MYDFDLHVHTDLGRKKIPAKVLLKRCQQVGLNGLAVTDHNHLNFYRKNKALFQRAGLVLIRACEIDSSQGHILAYGINEKIPFYLPAAETIERIKEQGGIAVAAHPFYMINSVGKLIHQLPFDGVELFNAFMELFPLTNKLAREHAQELDCLKIGGSDAHSLCFVGKGRTVFNSLGSEDDMLELIRQGSFEIRNKTDLLSLAREAFSFSLFDMHKAQKALLNYWNLISSTFF